jgi:hypothetical protein
MKRIEFQEESPMTHLNSLTTFMLSTKVGLMALIAHIKVQCMQCILFGVVVVGGSFIDKVRVIQHPFDFQLCDSLVFDVTKRKWIQKKLKMEFLSE